MELKDKIFGGSLLEKQNENTGTFKFSYPAYTCPCIKSQFYAFNKDEEVIEAFDPKFKSTLDLVSTNVDVLNTYSQTFSLSQLELWECNSEEVSCQSGSCTKYNCPISFHFYYDKGEEEFPTKQQEYEYTKNNSQAIFNSSFTIVMSKQTVVNTAIKTVDLDSVCTGVCTIDPQLSLIIKMKSAMDEEYEEIDKLSINWGEYAYFEITGVSENKFQLLNIVAITNEGEEMFTLGESFIEKFVNVTKEEKGLLEFNLQLTSETVLIPEQNCSLAFVVKEVSSTSLRLLEEDQVLPSAAIKKQDINFKNFAGMLKPAVFILLLIILLN